MKSLIRTIQWCLVLVLALGGTLTPWAPAAQAAAPAQSAGWTQGVPWTGSRGVTESVGQIMRRQQSADMKAAGAPPTAHAYPHLTYPDRSRLPDAPGALAVAQSPAPARQPAAPIVAPAAPQTVGLEYTAATLADTGAFPPDTMGAAGPTQFMLAINGRFRIFDKETGTLGGLNVDPDVFFASVITPGAFTSDPHVRYDPFTGRWFIVMIDVPVSQVDNRLLVAVSSGPTITDSSSFTFFSVNHSALPGGDATCLFDYPTLGIDINALYVGANMFCPTSFTRTNGYVIRKSSLTGGGPIVVTGFVGLVPTGTGAGPFTPQGVDNNDPAATEGYFIGVDNAAFSLLDLRRVSDPGGTPSISANVNLVVPTTRFPALVPHLGNTGGTNGNLDALDDRLFAAVLRNGRLWTAHNLQVSTGGVASASGGRDGVRWYEIQNVASPATPSLVQSGTVFDSAVSNPTSYWIPSVMVSGQGHAALGFSAAGAALAASAATTGRLSSDALGTTQAPPVVYETGTGNYNPPSDPGGAGGRRWGDFSYTSLDPLDLMTMWTIQEFNNSLNSYGVRVAKLIAPPPATPASASVASVFRGLSSVDVTITGVSTSGSGFFDPGPNLPAPAVAYNHIQASASAGVTVNSVTFTDPTHVTLNISTVGATAGPVDVTITNPDGQALTGLGLFSVTVPAATYADPALACASNAPCFATVQEALDNLANNGVATVYGVHNLAASLQTGGSGANNASVVGSGLATLNWTGGAGALFSVGAGSLNVKGLTLSGAPTVFAGGAGSLTAYANNISGFTNAFTGGGTPNIGHNYWGTRDPAAAAPAGMPLAAWAQRLGAPVSSWSEGSGSATLGTASLSGGAGTAVIVSMGRAASAANAPFGNGVAGHVDAMCSDFYDYFTIGGSGTWALALPVDAAPAGCTTNTLLASHLYRINDLSQCSPAGNTTCWTLAPGVSTIGSNLTLAGLSTADLGGTPFVAGDSFGVDPTAVQLSGLRAGGPGAWLLGLAAGLLAALLGGLALLRRRE